MAGTIRIGVVGAGNWARRFHIPNLLALADVQVVAVCNRSMQSGQQVAQQFGIPHVVDDWRKLVGLPDVDAVVICTWPHLHAPVAIAAPRGREARPV